MTDVQLFIEKEFSNKILTDNVENFLHGLLEPAALNRIGELVLFTRKHREQYEAVARQNCVVHSPKIIFEDRCVIFVIYCARVDKMARIVLLKTVLTSFWKRGRLTDHFRFWYGLQ